MKKRVIENKEAAKGFGFGLTSGTLTTLGMIVGLGSATDSKLVVLAGIISIAIADAFSDAFGIHISEEAEAVHSAKQLWVASVYAFLSKFVFAIIFVVPFLILDFMTATIASVCFGLTLISLYSWVVARNQGRSGFKAVVEHLLLSILVIIATHFVGDLGRILISSG